MGRQEVRQDQQGRGLGFSLAGKREGRGEGGACVLACLLACGASREKASIPGMLCPPYGVVIR